MSTTVIFTSWPYTQVLMGIHNLIPMLSGDMLSRFHKLMGKEVFFISGCDEYGERMERKARTENILPRELANINYAKVKDLLDSYNIDLSFFYRTSENDHQTFVQECLTNLFDKGYIEEKEIQSLFCPVCNQFIPDVFVLGFCTTCGKFDNLNDHYSSLSCGKNSPIEFRDAICGICKSTGVNTPLISEFPKRWVMKLDKSLKFDMSHWTEIARSETQRALTKTGDWISISRSVNWGITLPFDSSQTLFSWVDSLLGDLTVFKVKEELRNVGQDIGTIYCMGRDNIPFYTILYPSLLRYLKAEFLMPSIVVANHAICFDGLPCSKSQSRTIDLETALQLLPADYWRAYLISIFPLKFNADFNPIEFEQFVKVDLKELYEYIHNIHRLCVELSPRSRNEIIHCSATHACRLNNLLRNFQTHIESYDFSSAMSLIFLTVKESNATLRDILIHDNYVLADVCNDFLREIFVLNFLVSIFMPDTSKKILATFNFLNDNCPLNEIYKEDFTWKIEEGVYEELFPDLSIENAITKIKEMVNSIEFSDGIDYTSDKHPVRIKWDACNCETWYQSVLPPLP